MLSMSRWSLTASTGTCTSKLRITRRTDAQDTLSNSTWQITQSQGLSGTEYGLDIGGFGGDFVAVVRVIQCGDQCSRAVRLIIDYQHRTQPESCQQRWIHRWRRIRMLPRPSRCQTQRNHL
jgi:hypothetical protein